MPLIDNDQPEVLKLYASRQAKCTECGSTQVEYLNQFCRNCWERYSPQYWTAMLRNAEMAESEGTIVETSPQGGTE